MLLKSSSKKSRQQLDKLPKIPQNKDEFRTLLSAKEYRKTLLDLIANAQYRIVIIALYLEQDDAGKDVLHALYQAKKTRPQLEISVLVDWHRAQRGRIGETAQGTNADWYCAIATQHPDVSVPIYGIPINTREALGVLHLKGSIIDDTVVYSGASINDVYLHRHDKYRYDRYHLLTNPQLADTFVLYAQQNLISSEAVHRLDDCSRPRSADIKKSVRSFRNRLRQENYQFDGEANNEQLALTPLVGVGRHSQLNKNIVHLFKSTQQKITICTPYFNLPPHLVKNLIRLLRQGKHVEIIVGDKTANDFFIPEDQPFKMIGALPYLYEMNLRRFATHLQNFTDKGSLSIRLWKDDDHSYHLKGVWIDNEWILITGNNLNPRAMHLDLENAVLIHDPQQELSEMVQQELDQIRQNTTLISHYQQLQCHQFYPEKVRKLIQRVKRIKADKIINRLL